MASELPSWVQDVIPDVQGVIDSLYFNVDKEFFRLPPSFQIEGSLRFILRPKLADRYTFVVCHFHEFDTDQPACMSSRATFWLVYKAIHVTVLDNEQLNSKVVGPTASLGYGQLPVALPDWVNQSRTLVQQTLHGFVSRGKDPIRLQVEAKLETAFQPFHNERGGFLFIVQPIRDTIDDFMQFSTAAFWMVYNDYRITVINLTNNC